MGISKNKRISRLGALFGRRIQDKARKTKPQTDERMRTFKLKSSVAPGSTISAKTIGSLGRDGRGSTRIPNDFVDYLFPYLDHNSGSKKASAILIILMRLTSGNKPKNTQLPPTPSLSVLAALSAQTIKTVQSTLDILAKMNLVDLKRRSGKNTKYTLKNAELLKLTKVAMKRHGLQIIE